MKKIITIICICVFAVAPYATNAFTFDKDFLISDQDMVNSTYLSSKGVQSFLEEKGSVLASMTAIDADGVKKSVARIITTVSETYTLNPMLFLVMAQKESSAITSSTLTYAIEHWILGFGRCDSCSEEQAAPYRGITKQFNAAASRIRNGYLDDLDTKGTTISGWGVGSTKTTIDGIEVTPQNKATAALYTYNPCVGAYGGGTALYGCNSAFQKLWQAWNPSFIRYPNGTLLQIGETVYLIQKGAKRPFTSYGALVSSYDPDAIIPVPSIVGEQYDNGAPISFPNYSLLRNPHGTIYLLVDGKKRGFATPEALRQLGFNPEEVIDARWSEINPLPEGKPITVDTLYPGGAVVQNKINGAVAYIDPRGKRHDVWSPIILDNRFSDRSIIQIDSRDFNQYPAIGPATLKDGTLIQANKGKKVYVIADGKRRPFLDEKTFTQLGYKWERVEKVPKKIVELHEKGKAMKMPSTKKSSLTTSSTP